MQHGGDLFDAIAEFGGETGRWLDLSTGINPTPWPIPLALLEQSLYRLPARSNEDALLDAARVVYRVSSDVALLAAPGTQARIQWIPHLAGLSNEEPLRTKVFERLDNVNPGNQIVRN